MRQIPLLLALPKQLVSLLEILLLIFTNADAFLDYTSKVNINLSSTKNDLNVYRTIHNNVDGCDTLFPHTIAEIVFC